MPEDTWYFIGPDKTGFDCADNCCAGFSDNAGVCRPYACATSPSRFRKYLCPNPEFPTPNHVYTWGGGPDNDVTINVNSITCPNVSGPASTQCYIYTPSDNLNAAGRIGSGCSQAYVTAINNCTTSLSGCPDECGFDPCYTPVGFIVYPNSCVETSSGCACSSGSSFSTCSCSCNFDNPECICTDPCSETCVVICPGNTQIEYNCCDPIPTCACGPTEEVCPPCTTCENDICVPLPCPPTCPSGFACSCGECVCDAESTCCVGYSKGWSYSNRFCLPCYEGWQDRRPTPDCCYRLWRQKGCENANEVCCNDGRCYQEDTVLCDIRPPAGGPVFQP